jgi:hypothetical protein
MVSPAYTGMKNGSNRNLVGDVVDDDGRLRSPVVHWGQRVVPLLAGGVPNLELDGGLVQANGLGEEGGPDGGLLVLVELALDEPEHQRRLAHRRLAEQHQLQLVIGIGNCYLVKAFYGTIGGFELDGICP